MPHRKRKQRKCMTQAAIAASRPPPKPKKNPLGARYLDSCSHPDALPLPSENCQPIGMVMQSKPPASTPAPAPGVVMDSKPQLPVPDPNIRKRKALTALQQAEAPKNCPPPIMKSIPGPPRSRLAQKKRVEERKTKNPPLPPSFALRELRGNWEPCPPPFPNADQAMMHYMFSRFAECEPVYVPGASKVFEDKRGNLQFIQSGYVVVPRHSQRDHKTRQDEDTSSSSEDDDDLICERCIQEEMLNRTWTNALKRDVLLNVISGRGDFGFKVSEYFNQKLRKKKKPQKPKPKPKQETYSHQNRKIILLSQAQAAAAANAEIDRKTEEIKAQILGYNKEEFFPQPDGQKPDNVDEETAARNTVQNSLTKLFTIDALEFLASSDRVGLCNLDFAKLIDDSLGVETLREMRSKVTKDIQDFAEIQNTKKNAKKAAEVVVTHEGDSYGQKNEKSAPEEKSTPEPEEGKSTTEETGESRSEENEKSAAAALHDRESESEPELEEKISENVNSSQTYADDESQNKFEEEESGEDIYESKINDEIEKTVVLAIPEKFYADVVRFCETLKEESRALETEKSKSGCQYPSGQFDDINTVLDMNDDLGTLQNYTEPDEPKLDDNKTGEQGTANELEEDLDLERSEGQTTDEALLNQDRTDHAKVKGQTISCTAGRTELLKKDAELRKMLAEEERKEKKILESRNSEQGPQEVWNGRSKSPQWDKYERLFDDETLVGNTKDFGNLYTRGDRSLGKENIATCTSAASQVGPSLDGEQGFLFSTPIHPRRFPLSNDRIFGEGSGEDVTGIRSPGWEEKKKHERSVYRRFANFFAKRLGN